MGLYPASAVEEILHHRKDGLNPTGAGFRSHP